MMMHMSRHLKHLQATGGRVCAPFPRNHEFALESHEELEEQVSPLSPFSTV